MNFIRRSLFFYGVLLAALSASAQTQASNSFNPLSSTSNGFHIYGVTAYGAYYSSGTPFGLETTTLNPNQASSGVTAFGAAANVGWSKSTDRSSASIIYSPSYVGSPDNSQYNQFSQRAVINW